jgi:hypothetical protein
VGGIDGGERRGAASELLQLLGVVLDAFTIAVLEEDGNGRSFLHAVNQLNGHGLLS